VGLPDSITAWIGEVMGAPVTAAKRVPGGASREAWFVDVAVEGGPTTPLFLRYDTTPKPPGGLFHPLRVEAEVLIALQDTDVTVPRTIAVHPTEEAMLSERVSGETWFYRITDPDEQVRVARDFMRNLAALHRLDPHELDLPSFGPVKSARQHALDEIANMRRRAMPAHDDLDPMLRFALDWLERNVPDYDGPTLLVQGDTGPGNFMYEDGRVTAVVDWELAHFGDPMDDIAWLSLRTVQDTFTHFPDRLTEYEELSGHKIDESRVWYYRLFAEMRLATARPPSAPSANIAGRDLGNALIYDMLHRRLLIQALAHVVGIDLPALEIPQLPTTRQTYLYEAALDALREILPSVQDPLAVRRTKGVARILKYLKEVDRDRAAIPEPEAHHGGASDADYVRDLWHQVQRDDYLMREASGALRERTWPPLS
jgi:aminoglycoside phosphotransferase (APT) family kinase protein